MEPRDLTTVDLYGAVWKKSSHSGNNGGECVEVTTSLDGIIAVRDSKHPTGPMLTFAPAEWSTFLRDIKRGAKRHR